MIAPIVSTVFALGAALLFYLLMARVLPGSAALFAVVLFCIAPLSPILQVAYAESMHLFLLVRGAAPARARGATGCCSRSSPSCR